ncbi:MAG TPA: response regulator [Phycisphaerae bacterium]|nr:response regulator [Phycisphaerae bacterium]
MTLQPVVFVIDDDPEMRRAAGILLQSAGFRHDAFERATDFLLQYSDDQPGCIILDLSMPGMNGIEFLSRLRAQGSQIPVIILTGVATVRSVVRAMKLGIVDFFEKPADFDELLQTVQQALEIDAQRRARESVRGPVVEKLGTLTSRERELLDLLVQGFSSKQVAARLAISPKTVENHRSKLMQKMGALNIADLTRMTMIAEAA